LLIQHWELEAKKEQKRQKEVAAQTHGHQVVSSFSASEDEDEEDEEGGDEGAD